MDSNHDQPAYQVAVFDFDGTTINGQSGILLTKYLFLNRLLPARSIAGLAWWGLRYKLHLPFSETHSRELIFRGLAGRPGHEVDAVIDHFYHEHINELLRPRALEAVKAHREQGHVTLLVSATFDPVARAAARSMGVDGCVATHMVRDAAGVYTGEVDGQVISGAEKYRAVSKWCDEHLGEGQWEIVCAYGDHHTDRYLMAHAQERYAVNPGKTLRAIARRKGWQVVDWDS